MADKKKSARKTARKAARTPAGAKARGAAKGKPGLKHRRQPETLRLREVRPGFTVGDIDRSVAWYRDVLGCVVEETWTHEGRLDGAVIRCGSVRLYLMQDDWKKGRDRKKGEGVRLYCTTAHDVDHLAELIKSRGGQLTHGPQTQPWGVRDFGVLDPDGYRFTIQTAER